ncbi:MAG: TolC family protein, partial [Proteobacteria bacterium]|nr:TolC family protein [Pseudomonadota bacterium]
MKSFLRACMIVGVLFATAGISHAVETPAPQAALTLEDCVRMSLKAAPELGEAESDIDLATSKLDEAKGYRFPKLEMTTLFGPAPTAKRQDLNPINTDKPFSFNELTWFASADATVIQPLYTFGKISENMQAATHGIEVNRALKQQRANEIVQ